MKPGQLYLLLYVFSTASVLVNTFEPFLTAAAAAAVGAVIGVGVSLGPKVWYHYNEGCDSKWINFNARGLKHDLETKVFGQHIASRVILNAVYEFMNDKNPRKPLVLSLHGRTGTGKNFVSQLIAENIYKKGMDSSFVHMFITELHFPHSYQTDTYKFYLQRWIQGNITNCAPSMFIFDEIDKMDPRLINSLEPFLDYRKTLDKVSYQKAIFIFLSNAGGETITEKALDLYRAGREREKIKLEDLGLVPSGFRHTGLIDKNLVDHFVPFLPLESRHVVQCVLAEMKAKGLRPNNNVAEKVAKDLVYSPKSEKLFSASGCKTIKSKLDYYL